MKKQHSKYYFNHPEVWDAIRTETARKETRFLIKLFRRTGNIKTILDVGCGTGRHLEILVKNGFNGIGIDANKKLIMYARKLFPHINFIVADMKNIKLQSKFDAIICLCGVLHYSETNNEIKYIINSFYRLLNPGGVLVLDNINAIGFINRFKFKKHLTTKKPFNLFGLRCDVEHNIIEQKQILKEIRTISDLKTGTIVQKDQTKFRLFFPEELSLYLENSGFKNIKHFNGFNFSNGDMLKSFRMVTVAYKKHD